MTLNDYRKMRTPLYFGLFLLEFLSHTAPTEPEQSTAPACVFAALCETPNLPSLISTSNS